MRAFFILCGLLASAAIAQAHFIFVYVDPQAKDIRVVFGHGATPDPDVPVARAEGTKLFAKTGDTATELTVKKAEGNYYVAEMPKTAPEVIYGETKAGVTQRGEMPPMLSTYYSKTVPTLTDKAVAAKLALEFTAAKHEQGVRFQLLQDGKPVPTAEITLTFNADEDDIKVKTDKDGYTQVFQEKGTYALAAQVQVDKKGELDGKKYEKVRTVASIIVRLE